MSNALVTSTDDFYASLVAKCQALDAVQRRRPLSEALAEEAAAYEPCRFSAGLPAGNLLDTAATRRCLAELVRKVIKPGVLARGADFYFDLEGDAMLMSRQGRPQQVVPIKIGLHSITVGAGMGVAETIIVRNAWDAGACLTQAVIAVAAGYFARGRRF
nr:hypothetical protein [Brevundimonas diminuta]